ncbi:MCP four helix bundle domain-containing protein [Methylorubrum aminovorans]|uniref:MCP four helix bundle domain-containing protein n=1 Tax=Methylorubrum aminovorans TaxID=269069 RepID=UPI0024E10B8A|nr:MCP four helix bundle domain-containing protein [Methylorubrum aminovorans]
MLPVTIKSRLILMLSFMGLLLLISTGVGSLGLYLSNASLKTNFEDRLIPLSQFLAMRDSYDHIIETSRGAAEGQSLPKPAAEAIERSARELGKAWSDYVSTHLTDEEAKLVAVMQGQMTRNGAMVADLVTQLTRGDLDAHAAAHETLLLRMPQFHQTMSKLTDLQLRESRAEFARSQVAASWSGGAILACLLLACGGLAYGVVTVVGGVARPIKTITGTMSRLAAGDLTVAVEGAARRDEIGAMARAVQVFKDAMIARRDADLRGEQDAEATMRRSRTLDQAMQCFEVEVSGLSSPWPPPPARWRRRRRRWRARPLPPPSNRRASRAPPSRCRPTCRRSPPPARRWPRRSARSRHRSPAPPACPTGRPPMPHAPMRSSATCPKVRRRSAPSSA